MKDSNTTNLTIRAKVSSNLNNSISSLPPLVRTKSSLVNKSTNSATNNSINSSNQHNNSNNSDDEVDIDRLIIDLDADIEKSNDRLSSESESHFTPSTNSSKIMSSTISKTKDLNNGTNSTTQINQSTTQSNSASNSLSKTSGTSSSGNSSSQNSNLQTTTGDKSLKMKIQRKSIGGKSSGELKSEIVQSDSITSSRHSNSNSNLNFKTEKNGINLTNNNNSLANNLTSTSSNSSTSTPNDNEKEKIKHSSNKNKNSSHKEKKAKKDKSSNPTVKNGTEFTTHNSNSSNSNGDKDQQSNSSVVLNLDKKALNSNSNDHLSFNNQINQLKRENDSLDNTPLKKSKTDDVKNVHNLPANHPNNNNNTNNNKPKVEMRSVSTSTSVSTMTDPECLGFCEPGSAICLEGITWVEAEGVLVVNVTWRGKSYVGTLLDCTKHDWGPPHPRLCDSPTSDLESKGLKSGRGKRTRTSISEQDSRLFQSKLRNGKGRRNFTVPESPIKADQNKRNRNGTNSNNNKDNLETKSTNSNSQPTNSRDTPTLLESPSVTNSPLSKQPNSPQLIECPEPNCSKKYKHVNGLKYHQSHCHSGNMKGDDLLDDICKGEDAEEMEVEDHSNVNSPKSKIKIEKSDNCNENVTNNLQNAKQCDTENSLVKKPKINCDNKLDKDNCRENAGSPSAFSDISDVNENEPDKGNFSLNKSLPTDKVKVEEDELKKLNNSENLQKNKEIGPIKSENKPVKEDKSNDKEELINKSVNGVDKNGLANLINNQSPLMNPQPVLNPNFPFNPYNRMPPNTHFQLPIDPALQAYLMQDRLLEEQSFQANLNNFNNDLKNSLQHKPPNRSISPHNNRFSPQTSQQSSIFNQASNTQNQLNKTDTSPYDFIQHEKQLEESLKLASNKNAFGNLSSPKQQPSSLVAQHLHNQQQQQNSSMTSSVKEEQRTTPKHNASKQEENIKPPAMDLMKPTSETHGPPSQQPNHSFYHSIPPFLPATFPPSGFGQAANSFDPQVLRAVTSNPFNQNFMNNLRFPNSLPGAPQLPTSLANSQQEINSKLMGGFNSKQLPFDMMQHQYKEMQDRMLNISPNSAKNGLPNQMNIPRPPNQMPDLYGALINKAHNSQK